MARSIHRIAINTGGGDAPGLNAVIAGAVCAAHQLGWEVLGIKEGYDGILNPDAFAGDGVVRLEPRDVRGIAKLGGTILGTTNRGNPFKSVIVKDGIAQEVDRSDEVIEAMRRMEVDALIAIGGDGSLGIADQLNDKGLRLIGVPKTIDNDLDATVVTFGFDSAVEFATDCVDRLHSTAQAHRRIIVVEVMGRHAGWIALHAGVAGGAHAILIPEMPYDLNKLAAELKKRVAPARGYAIVVVAEGAMPKGGELTIKSRELGREVRLGGVGEIVADQLQQLTGIESRAVVLGHLVRGGSPTASDRLLGLEFGAAAVRGLADNLDGVMVALHPPEVRYVPIKQAIKRRKVVPPDGSTVATARALDILLGD
ncbi:MAG: ATP-dependent 6-phosphofructokinase [Tepidisphaeraceae bacterium]